MDIVPPNDPRLQRTSHATGDFYGLVGRSKVMEALYARIEKAAATSMCVLILGPTGTGKDLAAQVIHLLSPRRNGPYVPFSCADLTADTAGSELFGHVKGAFTNADRDAPGIIRAAHGGTLFIDELGCLVPKLQAKFLRVLQNKEVRPVGAALAQSVDVRVVAATLDDLPAGVQSGSIRQDFFYRLNGIVLRMPSLAERPDDVPLLARHLLARCNDARGPAEMTKEALARLAQHSFPGNVRELETIVERAYAFRKEAEVVTLDDLESDGFQSAALRASPSAEGPSPDDVYCVRLGSRRLSEEGAEIKSRTVAYFNGNKSMAAKALGVSRSSLREIKPYQP